MKRRRVNDDEKKGPESVGPGWRVVRGATSFLRFRLAGSMADGLNGVPAEQKESRDGFIF